MPQIQNKPLFFTVDCTETDKALTTIGAELHSTTDPVARRSEMACATKSLYTMAERLKITLFWLFSTYLLPFLELASVKHLETRQPCENDFGQ